MERNIEKILRKLRNIKLTKSEKDRIWQKIQMAMKNYSKKFLFIESCGTYPNEILVAINGKHEDMVKYLIGKKLKTSAYEKEEKSIKEFFTEQGRVKGFVFFFEDKSLLLWMQEFRDDWEWYETLMHECSHIAQFVLEDRKVRDNEAFSYQMEYLFRKLRRKIQFHYLEQKVKKLKSKKKKNGTTTK